MSTAEHSYGPESQFDQTTAYFDRLLETHGRAPVEGEIGAAGVDSRMRIDPNGKNYRLHDISIVRHVGGGYTVHHTYDTYTFNPHTQTVTNEFWMPPWTADSPAMEAEVSGVDDAGQRELIVLISDALHNGKVVEVEPLFPTRPARLTTAIGRLLSEGADNK